jgi:ceroid-lipofuscinosis MFS transporter 7
MQQPSADGIMRDSNRVDEENGNTPYHSMATEDVRPTYLLDDDDDMSMAPSIASSVMTADGIHDTVGFSIVCLVILIGDMSRGIMFPSMWPLVSSLGGSSVTLGYAVASFSFGRILVSPLFGTWSVTQGYTKTLLTSCSILLLGTLIYAQVENVGTTQFLIFAQIILGIGSGTLGVTRAFVAEVTATRNRTTYMAWITAVQYAGFTVTPFLGAFFNIVLQDVEIQYGCVYIIYVYLFQILLLRFLTLLLLLQNQ